MYSYFAFMFFKNIDEIFIRKNLNRSFVFRMIIHCRRIFIESIYKVDEVVTKILSFKSDSVINVVET